MKEPCQNPHNTIFHSSDLSDSSDFSDLSDLSDKKKRRTDFGTPLFLGFILSNNYLLDSNFYSVELAFYVFNLNDVKTFKTCY